MTAVGDFDETSAPPMVNGELQFDAPWQGRIFGMARSLCEAGLYTWDEFRERLIAQLDGVVTTGEDFAYYDHFQQALEQLLASKGVVANELLAARTEAFAKRPHGHDHSHHANHNH
jgi:nitrile hydratase accessory protein